MIKDTYFFELPKYHRKLSEKIFFCNLTTPNYKAHFYRKTARDTLTFVGTASSFAMFLHSMPDRVGHDVVVCLDVIAGYDVIIV